MFETFKLSLVLATLEDDSPTDPAGAKLLTDGMPLCLTECACSEVTVTSKLDEIVLTLFSSTEDVCSSNNEELARLSASNRLDMLEDLGDKVIIEDLCSSEAVKECDKEEGFNNVEEIAVKLTSLEPSTGELQTFEVMVVDVITETLSELFVVENKTLDMEEDIDSSVTDERREEVEVDIGENTFVELTLQELNDVSINDVEVEDDKRDEIDEDDVYNEPA